VTSRAAWGGQRGEPASRGAYPTPRAGQRGDRRGARRASRSCTTAHRKLRQPPRPARLASRSPAAALTLATAGRCRLVTLVTATFAGAARVRRRRSTRRRIDRQESCTSGNRHREIAGGFGVERTRSPSACAELRNREIARTRRRVTGAGPKPGARQALSSDGNRERARKRAKASSSGLLAVTFRSLCIERSGSAPGVRRRVRGDTVHPKKHRIVGRKYPPQVHYLVEALDRRRRRGDAATR